MIPRRDRSQVDQLDLVAEMSGGLCAAVHERAPSDNRDASSFSDDLRFAKWNHVLVARVARAAVTRHEERTMLKEYRWIRAAHRAPTEADRIRSVGRHRDLPAIRVRES